MSDSVIQLITALIGGVGFGLLFGMHPRHLIPSALGGVVAWAIYLGMVQVTGIQFLSCLVAAAAAVVYGEILARVRKTPATQFVMGGIVPLVPGSSLYRAMSCVVRGDMDGFMKSLPVMDEAKMKPYADFALETAMVDAKKYPPQMRDLVVAWDVAQFICSTVAIMTLDMLYADGTFRALTKEEKVAANLLMFADRIPAEA